MHHQEVVVPPLLVILPTPAPSLIATPVEDQPTKFRLVLMNAFVVPHTLSPFGSFTSSSCACLAGFTQSASIIDDQFCTQPDRSLPKDVPVLVSFAVQSKWASAVPPISDASLQGRNPFQTAFLADLTQALGIDVSRLSIVDVVAESEMSLKLNASTTGTKGIYVTVSFHIEPVTLSTSLILDSARDADGLAYSPTILGHFLEQMLGDTNSAVYQGTYTRSAQVSSLQEQSESAVVEHVPFTKSAAFTAILLAAAVVLVLILIAVLCIKSPKTAREFDVAVALVAVFTFVTSVIFISSLPSKGYPIAYVVSIIFMVVPTVINLYVVFKMIIKQRNSDEKGEVKKLDGTEEVALMNFDDWLKAAGDFNYILCIVMLISLISIDCLALITSQVLGRIEFSAPWKELQHEVQFWGILGVLFKTVPQLSIHIYVIQHEHQWTSLQVLSVSSSAIAVALGLCVRSIAYFVRRTRAREMDATKHNASARVGQSSELEANSSALPQVPLSKSTYTPYGNWTAPIPGQLQTEPAHLNRGAGPPGGHLMQSAGPSFAMRVNVVCLLFITLCALAIPTVDASLSSGSAGHTSSAPLTVYGNLTDVDRSGFTNDLLSIIKQQQVVIAAQQQTLASHAKLFQQLQAIDAGVAVQLPFLNCPSLQSE